MERAPNRGSSWEHFRHEKRCPHVNHDLEFAPVSVQGDEFNIFLLFVYFVFRRDKEEGDAFSDHSDDAGEYKDDSGIEGDPRSENSDSDFLKNLKTFDGPKNKLSLNKVDKCLENDLIHLSPLHLSKMLARKNRNTEGEQRSCRNCNFDQQKFSESPSRKLYHSPVKKRRQLAMRPPWKLSLSTRPSLRWDPFSGRTEYNGYVFSKGPTSGARGSPLSRSPVKKGILKNPDVAARAVYKNRKGAPVRGIVIRNHKNSL